jgi:hypothetical protein
MDALRGAIFALLAAENPMTNRQLFYRLVSAGLVAKTEGEYKSTVCRLLAEMRLDGTIPFGWVADNTRWMRKPRSYDDLEDFLQTAAQVYRRSLWSSADEYVECWIEKDALAGVVYEITAAFDVPLMVTRGYASLSFLYEAASHIATQRRPTHIYFFGDYDPSGVDIARTTESRLREFAPGAEIAFERVAVTVEQIEEMRLPGRPTKRTDSRSRDFGAVSVELDAIPPPVLRSLVEERIVRHVDRDQLAWLERVEAAERDGLLKLARAFQ